MSQHCDMPATRSRHPAGSVDDMNINRTHTSRITAAALTALLAVSLSACSVAVTDPEETTPPAPTSAPDESTTDDDATGGGFTDGDCDGQSFEVKEDASTVLMTGRCGDISITASGATINLEDADSVNVFGLDNVIIIDGEVTAVTIKGDRTSWTGDSVGSIKVQGNDSTVLLGTADDVRVSGDTNYVQWSHGVASAEDTGTGNTIVAASGD